MDVFMSSYEIRVVSSCHMMKKLIILLDVKSYFYKLYHLRTLNTSNDDKI